MAIKHLKPYTNKELKKLNPDIKFWKRREVLASPLIILVVFGFVIYYIGYGFGWVFKWTFLSWLAPFFDWPWLCEIGLHKYRFKKEENGTWSSDTYKIYECKICKKIQKINVD